MNWCWPKWGWIIPPYAIFFKTSCDKHDDYYEKWGDSFDRWIADIYLLKFMWGDCNLKPMYIRPYYYAWCWIYYIAVRVWGYKYFNYR